MRQHCRQCERFWVGQTIFRTSGRSPRDLPIKMVGRKATWRRRGCGYQGWHFFLMAVARLRLERGAACCDFQGSPKIYRQELKLFLSLSANIGAMRGAHWRSFPLHFLGHQGPNRATGRKKTSSGPASARRHGSYVGVDRPIENMSTDNHSRLESAVAATA